MAKKESKKQLKQRKQKIFNFSKTDYWGMMIIIVFAFVIYGNTIPNDYALDDGIVITGNEFTKQGVAGIKEILSNDLFTGFYGKGSNMVAGGRYRPLSLVTFALEYQVFGENPHISHFINILLYALTGLSIYLLLLYLFKRNGIDAGIGWLAGLPFLTSMLFIAHPIHTEAVANIKGRDEILALLFALTSLLLFLVYLDKRKVSLLVWGTLSFFLAIISKENAAVFLAIIPLTVHFFTNHKVKEEYKQFIPYISVFVLFVILRQMTILDVQNELADDLMNNPFVQMTFAQKYATITYTLGFYLKLLVYPFQLTYDYYPYHIPIVNFSELKAIVPLVIYIGMIAYAVMTFNKKSVFSYSIWFFLIPLSIVSNIVFPIGVFMNERFVYMSSLGFIIAFCYFLTEYAPKFLKNEKILNFSVIGIVTLILIIFSVQTIARNNDWKDSYTLFTTDVKVSGNSSKGNSLAGEYLLYEARKIQDPVAKDSLYKLSIQYNEKSVEIYPKNVISLFNLAATHFERNKNFPEIVKTYKKLLAINPNGNKIFQFLNIVFQQCQDIEYKLKVFKEIQLINPSRYDINFWTAQILMNQSKFEEAGTYFNYALRANPTDFDALNNLGFCNFQRKDYQRALEAFLGAEKIRPGDKQLLNNIASIYNTIGDVQKSNEYKAKATK